VEALLTQHYDPAYLKSINRNFSGYQKALPVNMQDISAAAFASAAAILLSDVM